MSAAKRIEEDENVPANPSPTPAHTPTPWYKLKANFIGANPLGGDIETCQIVAEVPCQGANDADVDHIVSCVNGCEGLNPAAYKECVEALTVCLQTLERSGSSLLAAVANSPESRAREAARAALTRARGGGA